MGSNCYSYELLELPRGKLDDCIDATIVLTMENSNRHQQILKEILSIELTTKVIFQINKGYKNCEKDLEKQSSHYDLNHALKTAFTFALNSGFTRILVLEDDCEFDHKSFSNPQTIADIYSFIKRVDPEVYNLGQPFATVVPYGIKHVKMIGFVNGTQSIIYNRKHMLKRLKKKDKLPHVDFTLIEYDDKYSYYMPLTGQKFEETENSSTWGNFFGIDYFKFLQFIFYLSGNQTNPVRSYKIMYFSSLLIIYLILFLIVRFIYLKLKNSL